MIKVRTDNPTTFHFVCDTYEEKNFVDLHENELFDNFINEQTHGKIKNLNDLWEKAIDDEFGTTSIKYFWYISKGLEYPTCIEKFQDFINKSFKNFNSSNMVN